MAVYTCRKCGNKFKKLDPTILLPVCDPCKKKDLELKELKEQTKIQNKILKQQEEMTRAQNVREQSDKEQDDLRKFKRELDISYHQLSKKFTDKVSEVSKKHPDKYYICFTSNLCGLKLPEDKLFSLINTLYDDGRYIGTEHYFGQKYSIELDKTAFIDWKKEQSNIYSKYSNENQITYFYKNNKDIYFHVDSVAFLNKSELELFEKLLKELYNYVGINLNLTFIFDAKTILLNTIELEMSFKEINNNIFGVENKMAVLIKKLFKELKFINMPNDYYTYIEFIKIYFEDRSLFLAHEKGIRKILKIGNIQILPQQSIDNTYIIRPSLNERQETVSEEQQKSNSNDINSNITKNNQNFVPMMKEYLSVIYKSGNFIKYTFIVSMISSLCYIVSIFSKNFIILGTMGHFISIPLLIYIKFKHKMKILPIIIIFIISFIFAAVFTKPGVKDVNTIEKKVDIKNNK